MRTRDLVLIGLLVAIGTLSAHVLSIPVAGARVFPVQHAINVLAAVLLGPAASVTIAFAVGLLRNVLGTGTLLAFPGGMVGALLAGHAYRLSNRPWAAAVGEVFGTGALGAMLAYPIARTVLGHRVMALAYVIPFSLSSVTGAVIGLLLLATLRGAGVSPEPARLANSKTGGEPHDSGKPHDSAGSRVAGAHDNRNAQGCR